MSLLCLMCVCYVGMYVHWGEKRESGKEMRILITLKVATTMDP